MAQTFDVIVVGAGAMGSAACFHLAQRGHRVLGLEQFDIPHGKGSSHGHSRMIRLAYFEHSAYVPLLRQAYLLWHQLETHAGRKIIHITGGLYMGRPQSELMAGARKAVHEHHLPHENLSRDQLRARFPQFEVPDDYDAMIDHNAGLVLSEQAIAAHCEQALQRGAVIHGQEKVLDWEAGASGVTVKTSRETYHAAHVIFTSGAWTSKIVGELGVKLNVTRQVLGWLWPKRPENFTLGRFPVWMIENPDATNHYGFPMLPENPGFKVAAHVRTHTVDPDTISRDLAPGDEETFRPAVQFIPSADGPLLALRVCMYTNTPDTHFIIDRHPEHKNVTIACGFSGHGFKFSSVVGQILTELAIDGKSSLPIGFLGLQRFKKST